MTQAATGTVWTDGHYTVADGTRLHYVEMGRGTPVILIRAPSLGFRDRVSCGPPAVARGVR